MSDLKEQALALRGTRVEARIAGATVLGELRFVTPAGLLVLALEGDGGAETSYPVETLEAVADARHSCAKCGDRVNRVFAGREDETLMCSDCSRKRAYKLPPPVMACPECNAEPAFYSPGDKTYACVQCHGKRKGLTGLGVESRVLQAVCRGADTDDERHEWKQLRTSRWRCRSCHADRYVKPVGWDLRSSTF